MAAMSLAGHLGLCPKYSSSSNIGGSSFLAHALDAAMALEAGLIDVAVIAYGSNQRTAGGFRSVSEPMPFEAQYEPRNPITAYALAASRYMHEFQAVREDLAEVAVAARGWAGTGRPMSARQLVEAMLAKKYWSSGGQTPHATISSALQREIQNKGQQSRFRKTAPGRFALAKSKA